MLMPSLLLHGCTVGPTDAMSCVHVNAGVSASFVKTVVTGGAEHGICIADSCTARFAGQSRTHNNTFCGIVLSDKCHLSMSDSASDGHVEGTGVHVAMGSSMVARRCCFDGNYTGMTLDGHSAPHEVAAAATSRAALYECEMTGSLLAGVSALGGSRLHMDDCTTTGLSKVRFQSYLSLSLAPPPPLCFLFASLN